MGIFGLKHHIEESSYYEDYELQNTDLAIDGSNVFNTLYQYAHSNPVFGGDYDEFAQTIRNFFNCLLECEVKPIVFLHGGSSESHTVTVLLRLKSKIDKSLHMLPDSPDNKKMSPLFLRSVFIQVLKEMDIPLVQCLSNFDNSIVAVAKALNCPVLSSASYFYLHGVLYIPSETLLNNVMNHLDENRKMIPCKLYRLERLLNSFEGLNQYKLVLISILLSNDNIKLKSLVNDTISLIKEEHVANYQGVPVKDDLIAMVLHWLRKYTLEDAITEIIKRAPQSMRQELLKKIETNINTYTNSFAEAFTHLNVPEECFSNSTKEPYRFKGNIETLPYGEVHNAPREGYVMEVANKLLNQTQQLHKDSVIDKLPQWFKHEYWLANFPGYAMNLIRYHYHIFPTVIEDFSEPPSCKVALQIVRVVFGLLISVTENNRKMFLLNNVIRQRGSFVVAKFVGPITVRLSEIRRLSHSGRKKILDDALGIKNVEFIDELLPEWQLYITCLRYWRDNKISKCDKSHIYSILTCLIYKLTYSKMGYYNSLTIFQKSNSSVIELLQKRRDKSNIKSEYSTMVTVAQACKEIDTLDCLLAAPFFISHSQEKPDLSHGHQFKKHILYAFAQFQYTVLVSMDLNALIDCPYEQPKIANLYNGTLLYNLCANYQICEDMETYKNNIFKDSPSLLRAFNVLFKFFEKYN